jgi:hypothetical protein
MNNDIEKIFIVWYKKRQQFVEHNINGQRLLALTEDDLKTTLKITKFAIYRKLSLSITKLRECTGVKFTNPNLQVEKEIHSSKTLLNEKSEIQEQEDSLQNKKEKENQQTLILDTEKQTKRSLSQQLPEYRETKKLKLEYSSQPTTSSSSSPTLSSLSTQKSLTTSPSLSVSQILKMPHFSQTQNLNIIDSLSTSSPSFSARLQSSSSLAVSPSSSLSSTETLAKKPIQLKAYLAFLDPVRLGRRIPLAYGSISFKTQFLLFVSL